MDYKENYEFWLNSACFDEETKKELEAIKNDDKEIKERFHQNLAFGTGGLRGIIGAGTNRMNTYTVRKATQGLANFILKQKEEGDVKNMGVAIAYDSRRMSPEFAEQAALVLCGNGIKAYVFESLRPTPELSFAVRHLGCIAGIVITASHNPPEYNGYKAYWSDGGQIPYPKDEQIIEEVEAVESFASIQVLDRETATKNGLYQVIGTEIDDEFIKNVKAQTVAPDLIREMAEELTIVYTPLHGTGNKPVRRVLDELGYKNVHIVKEQEQPDSEFSTVGYPNPEDPKAFTLAMKLADEVSADIVVGTDPDADRVGAVVKNNKGEYVFLSGNMTGVLIAEYILSQKKAKGTLPNNAALISTIVSTELTKEIAKHYGIAYFDVLTGFKYIGEKIKDFEQTSEYDYQFGFEESYGCLAGTYARDKDAIVATMLICELAAFYKKRRMSLYEGLQEIYEKYGYYKETIQSITLKGIEGIESIRKVMKRLRTEKPTEFAGRKLVSFRDYESGVIKDCVTQAEAISELPKSDVPYYVLEGDAWFCIRPSGTEPKLKVYFGVKADSNSSAAEALQALSKDIMEIITSFIS